MKYKNMSFFLDESYLDFSYAESKVGAMEISGKEILIYFPKDKEEIWGERVYKGSLKDFLNLLGADYIYFDTVEFDRETHKREFRLRKGEELVLRGSFQEFMHLIKDKLLKENKKREG